MVYKKKCATHLTEPVDLLDRFKTKQDIDRVMFDEAIQAIILGIVGVVLFFIGLSWIASHTDPTHFTNELGLAFIVGGIIAFVGCVKQLSS